MCSTCGCSITPSHDSVINSKETVAKTVESKSVVSVLTQLLSENDHQATHNREHFDQHHVFAVNLMSSPGAGKTTLLEATIDALKDEFRLAVIEGDLETENDAVRIRRKGVPAIQIVTGTACHLDAHLIHQALHHLDLTGLDLLFIENVGNLVCPASFDLGQHRNITLLSTPEGDDKPAKYPVMFRTADIVLITKTDLLPVLEEFDPNRAEHYFRQLANAAPVIQLSAKTSTGLTLWLNWLRKEIALQRQRISHGYTARPGGTPDSMRLPESSPLHIHGPENEIHHSHQ